MVIAGGEIRTNDDRSVLTSPTYLYLDRSPMPQNWDRCILMHGNLKYWRQHTRPNTVDAMSNSQQPLPYRPHANPFLPLDIVPENRRRPHLKMSPHILEYVINIQTTYSSPSMCMTTLTIFNDVEVEWIFVIFVTTAHQNSSLLSLYCLFYERCSDLKKRVVAGLSVNTIFAMILF